jgi:hypothetical protein
MSAVAIAARTRATRLLWLFRAPFISGGTQATSSGA